MIADNIRKSEIIKTMIAANPLNWFLNFDLAG